MDRLGEEIKALITERFGSVPKFAGTIHMPAQTIYSSLRNGFLGSSISTAVPIAEGLDIDLVQLMHGKIVACRIEHDPLVDVPLIDLHADYSPGDPIWSCRTHSIPHSVYAQWPDAFLVQIRDDSMNRVLPNGCYALVNPCSRVDKPAKPYALSVGGSAMVRRLRMLGHGIEISPDSNDPTFRPAIYDFGVFNPAEVRIIGRVVWYTLPEHWEF